MISCHKLGFWSFDTLPGEVEDGRRAVRLSTTKAAGHDREHDVHNFSYLMHVVHFCCEGNWDQLPSGDRPSDPLENVNNNNFDMD